ncbi:hypothetical protein PM082_019474 [Marasmius tenuissimus]|nr:hypothetical protein PM082_019474 [Marasmius tenuissimus]
MTLTWIGRKALAHERQSPRPEELYAVPAWPYSATSNTDATMFGSASKWVHRTGPTLELRTLKRRDYWQGQVPDPKEIDVKTGKRS